MFVKIVAFSARKDSEPKFLLHCFMFIGGFNEKNDHVGRSGLSMEKGTAPLFGETAGRQTQGVLTHRNCGAIKKALLNCKAFCFYQSIRK